MTNNKLTINLTTPTPTSNNELRNRNNSLYISTALLASLPLTNEFDLDPWYSLKLTVC